MHSHPQWQAQGLGGGICGAECCHPRMVHPARKVTQPITSCVSMAQLPDLTDLRFTYSGILPHLPFAFIRKHADDIALIWFGIPCTSWSRARRHDGGPPPLRDDNEFLQAGCPNLSPKDQKKVSEGNSLLQVTLLLISLANSLHITWVLENPFTSRIWLVPDIKALQKAGSVLLRVDYCAYGTPWRKSTGLLHSGFHNLPNACFTCHSCAGRCEFSGHRHLSLTGKDSNNQWMTLRAQPYPLQLCKQVALQLLEQFGGHL